VEGSSKRGIVTRQAVEASRPVDEYREPLREDFVHSCAYCSITEAEARGIGFQIDHYHPRSQGGVSEYENLMYSCQPCNSRKDEWVSDEAARAAGRYVIRVDEEDPRDHLELQPEDNVKALTTAGEHNIKVFDLNKRPLRAIRRVRRTLGAADDVIANGLRVLDDLRIDVIPSDRRFLVAQYRAAARRDYDELKDALADLLRGAARSELLDPDADAKERSLERRKYLREQRALLPTQPRRSAHKP
jgi:hypothetical protein